MSLQQVLRGPMGLTCRQVRSAKFRENGILVDGERSRVSRILKAGEEVRVLLEDAAPAATADTVRGSDGWCITDAAPQGFEDPGTQKGRGADGTLAASMPELKEEQILYEDEDLLLVNKSAGICVHPSHGHYGDTLADQVLSRYRRQGITEIPRVIGRLDKDTSGIVLFARNKVAAQRLFDQCDVRKEYLAVAAGRLSPSQILQLSKAATPEGACTGNAGSAQDPCLPENASFTITCPIARDPASLNRMIADPEGAHGGKKAVTHVQVLFYDPERDASLVRLVLETGRTHQIRVHMAWAGHPLLGDALYGTGDPSEVFRRAALHCCRMRLVQPFTGELIDVRAPLPEDFARFTGQKKWIR